MWSASAFRVKSLPYGRRWNLSASVKTALWLMQKLKPWDCYLTRHIVQCQFQFSNWGVLHPFQNNWQGRTRQMKYVAIWWRRKDRDGEDNNKRLSTEKYFERKYTELKVKKRTCLSQRIESSDADWKECENIIDGHAESLEEISTTFSLVNQISKMFFQCWALVYRICDVNNLSFVQVVIYDV